MTSETINQMVHRIAERFHPRRIVLFGSYAAGTAQPESDVDLLVISDNVDPWKQALAIRRCLAQFPVACDVIVKSQADYERQRRQLNHIVFFADRYGQVVYDG